MLKGKPDPSPPPDDDSVLLDIDPNDPEEAQDLGFIVDEHDDRRITLTDGWQRVNDLDTDEPLNVNPRGWLPHEQALRRHGPTSDAFPSDRYVRHTAAEDQEEDFRQNSMLDTDPDSEAEVDSEDTQLPATGSRGKTDIAGRVAGVAPGFGTSLPQDLGKDGFQIREG